MHSSRDGNVKITAGLGRWGGQFRLISGKRKANGTHFRATYTPLIIDKELYKELKMDNIFSIFEFITGEVSYDTKDVFFVKLDPNISTTDELFNALYYTLWFPGYFGFNWNALEDCLSDFEWIGEYQIVIFHSRLPGIPDSDLKVYLEILRDVVIKWRGYDNHQFDVLFNESDRVAIEHIFYSEKK